MSHTHLASATFKDGGKKSEPCKSKSAAIARAAEWSREGAKETRVSPMASKVAVHAVAPRQIPAWAIPTIQD